METKKVILVKPAQPLTIVYTHLNAYRHSPAVNQRRSLHQDDMWHHTRSLHGGQSHLDGLGAALSHAHSLFPH